MSYTIIRHRARSTTAFTRKEDWHFIIPAAIIWFTALGVIAWDFVVLQKMTWKVDLIAISGMILTLAGVTLRVHARITLGRYFLHGIRTVKGHELIQQGVYRYVRHPAYLGAMLIYMSTPLLFHSVYGVVLMLPLIPLILYRIRIEEAMLIETFGEKYKDYMNHSKKVLPYLF
jgi:protein-S-isoprenylcysteine O-methyltransferase Ste14